MAWWRGSSAVFAIAHTSRMSFSFLYEWAIPLIVFSLSLRALDDPACNVLASVLACAAALYVEVLFFAILRAHHGEGILSSQRDVRHLPCHGSAGISRGRDTGGIGIAALWPAAVLGARVPVRGDAAAVSAPAETL